MRRYRCPLSSARKTRICQYQSLENGKGAQIVRQIVLSKIEGRNSLLRKYGLKIYDSGIDINRVEASDLSSLRRKLTGIEGKHDEHYFKQIFLLISEKLRPGERHSFQAYDGVNNLFNLAYKVLSWKVHRALVSANLEPYLGFLHSLQERKPSLVCDFKELYRYLIDDFVIQYYQNLKRKDFTVKTEALSRKKLGKREYLNDSDTKDFMRELEKFFETMVEIPRIRVGKRQTVETLVNEEALLLAQFLRNEKTSWVPRIVSM